MFNVADHACKHVHYAADTSLLQSGEGKRMEKGGRRTLQIMVANCLRPVLFQYLNFGKCSWSVKVLSVVNTAEN